MNVELDRKLERIRTRMAQWHETDVQLQKLTSHIDEAHTRDQIIWNTTPRSEQIIENLRMQKMILEGEGKFARMTDVREPDIRTSSLLQQDERHALRCEEELLDTLSSLTPLPSERNDVVYRFGGCKA